MHADHVGHVCVGRERLLGQEDWQYEGLDEVLEAHGLKDWYDPILGVLELARNVLAVALLHARTRIDGLPELQVMVAADEVHPLAMLGILDRRCLHRDRAKDLAHVGLAGDLLAERLEVCRLERELHDLEIDLNAHDGRILVDGRDGVARHARE